MEWIPVSERLPEHDTRWDDLSVDVLAWIAITFTKACYDYANKEWFNPTNGERLTIIPSHWAIITPPTEGE